MFTKKRVCWGILVLFLITFILAIGSEYILSKLYRQEYNKWSSKAILVSEADDEVTFILPKDKKYFTIDDIGEVAKPYLLSKWNKDIKIDGRNVILSFIEDKNELSRPYTIIVIKYDINDKSQKKIIAIDNEDEYRRAQPEIVITKTSYWIICGNKVFRLDKNLTNVTKVDLKFRGEIIVDHNDQVIYRELKTIYRYKEGESKPIYLSTKFMRISGWGPNQQSIVLWTGKGVHTFINSDGDIVGSMKSPTNKYAHVENYGIAGNTSLVYFASDNGEMPIWDNDIVINAYLDWVPYSYFSCFLYDYEENKYFPVPKDLLKLLDNRIPNMYEGNIDMDYIQQGNIVVHEY